MNLFVISSSVYRELGVRSRSVLLGSGVASVQSVVSGHMQVTKKLDSSSWCVRSMFDISYQIVGFESVVESCSCQSLFVLSFCIFRKQFVIKLLLGGCWSVDCS